MSEDCHESNNQQEQKQRAGEYGPNPFAHVRRPATMEGCLDCCEACAWDKEQRYAARERLQYPPEAVRLSTYDDNLLKSANIKWEGDTRS